jgi:hypothetical protein
MGPSASAFMYSVLCYGHFVECGYCCSNLLHVEEMNASSWVYLCKKRTRSLSFVLHYLRS